MNARGNRVRVRGWGCQVLSLVLGLGFAGCATPGSMGAGPDPDPTSGVNPDGTPRWIQRASGAYDGKYGRAFYGVGLVENIQSESLARQTAANRARAEIAKLFRVYVATMMQDYQRDTSMGGPTGGGSAQEQDIVATQRTISEVTLRGVEVRDYWADPDRPVLYALAVLELNKVAEATGPAGLTPAVTAHVRRNAERAFEQMDQQLERDIPSAPLPHSAPAEESKSEPATSPAGAPLTSEGSAPSARVGSISKARIGLNIDGRDGATIQTCFAGRLIAEGYELVEGSSDVDVLVTGKLVEQSAGAVDGIAVVKATINLRVIEQSTGRTLGAATKSIKVSRPEVRAARLAASTKLCDLVIPEMVTKIREAIESS